MIGDLTLTRVERTVTATPTEADAEPVYGTPVSHNETHEIRFLFPSVSVEHRSGTLAPAMQQKRGVLEIMGSARIDRDEFPEVFRATRETDWPPVVQNVVQHKDCHMPSTAGEDYSGAVCTAKLIAATRDDNCHILYSVGEDYSGSQCTPAAGNETTIVLDLKFLHKVSEPSVGMLSGDSKAE